MNKTKWIIFVVVVVGLFAGIIALNKSNDVTFSGDATKIINEGEIKDNVFGTTDQKVVLIEYGDYQCPGCGAMYQPIKALTEQYKDKVTFIFRNMPLTNIHPNALAASTVAEAAGLQGKYYEMHSLLYTNQKEWSDVAVDQRASVFEGYANQLGLNIDQYKKDLSLRSIADKINRDKQTAKKDFNVDSTPTFVLNGTVIKGQDAVSADTMKKKLEEAIRAAYGDAAVAPSETTPTE